jgi:hypothetical protein
MDAKEYVTRAEACLSRVAKWLEEFDPDESTTALATAL